MTINERIKAFRKDKKLSQKQFAASIGVTQSGVSYMEQAGSTVSDSAIKTICSVYGLNESWLRDGTEPMCAESDMFKLEQFVRDRGGSELEVEIVKAYFELDKDAREVAIDYFIDRLAAAKAKAAEKRQPVLQKSADEEADRPLGDQGGKTVEELEALYAEQQYKKTASGSA